jgi:hypothetical protein
MKKILFVLCIPLLFGSCLEDALNGTVKLEVTCQAVPFEVSYNNEHENDVTETSNTTYWSKEFEALTGHHCTLTFDNPNWISTEGSGEVNCSMSIKWKGSVLTSFEGEVQGYNLIQAFP